MDKLKYFHCGPFAQIRTMASKLASRQGSQFAFVSEDAIGALEGLRKVDG